VITDEYQQFYQGVAQILEKSHFDLSLSGIIEYLQLRKPVYRQVAAYGHFGRDDLQLTWEAIENLNS